MPELSIFSIWFYNFLPARNTMSTMTTSMPTMSPFWPCTWTGQRNISCYLYSLNSARFYLNFPTGKLLKKIIFPTTKKYRNAEFVQRCACFINVQLSLLENVTFSVCACIGNAMYIIFIMWNSISGLEPWYYFRFNISCGVVSR